MTVDYAAIATEVGTALGDVGMAATIKRKGAVTGGPEYSPTRAADEAHAVTVMQTSLSKLIRAGALVEGAEAAFMASTTGLTITPTTQDRLLVGSVEYSIIDVAPLAPAGVVVFYTLQVKR